MTKYAPHPNLFLYHESFARTKFRIPKESFVILHTIVPSTVATSTTSIQIYDDVGPTSATHIPLNTSQQPVQDHRSTGPASSIPIDCRKSLVASPIFPNRVNRLLLRHPTYNRKFNSQSQTISILT